VTWTETFNDGGPLPTGTSWPSTYSVITSDPYSLTGPQPYVFMVTAPNGPIPAPLQPYEVPPLYDGGGHAYFSLEVDAGGPFGAWTLAQIQATTVAALDQTGWLISTFTPVLP
jgi:hypothetical protein